MSGVSVSVSMRLQRPDGALYAQRRAGRKLHHVMAYADGTVDYRAACGQTPDPKRGNWRMTCNVPLAHYCQNCRRVAG